MKAERRELLSGGDKAHEGSRFDPAEVQALIGPALRPAWSLICLDPPLFGAIISLAHIQCGLQTQAGKRRGTIPREGAEEVLELPR